MSDQANHVRGVLKVDIPDPAVSLTLTFESSNDGDRWDTERLASALTERGLRTLPPPDRLGAFFKKAVADGGAYSEIVLEGVEPQIATADRVEWSEELAMPEELVPVRDRVLEKAQSPTIHREVQEKVQREKQVVKKGRLPFRQSTTETITVTETVKRREKVYIDPAVERTFFVETGRVIGRVEARRTGIPGRDIFGHTIPVKQLTDPGFYPGDNVTRTGADLVAGADGFLRVGRNWVDIVPFSVHRWSVELSRDNATCYLSLTPGHQDADMPSARAIRDAAIALPYPEESLMEEDDLTALIESRIADGEAVHLPITLSRDASFDIFVTPDKLQAVLNIHKGKGRGKPLNLKEVGSAIKSSNLKGLDFKRIGADIKEFYDGAHFDLTGYVLAEGTPPKPGPERQVEFAVRFAPPEETEKHKAGLSAAAPGDIAGSLEEFPAQAIQKTAVVEAEQLVCTIDPETPGDPGVDVYGGTIPAISGVEPSFHLHEGLSRKNDIIVTTTPGLLDYAEIEGEYYLRIRTHIDALVSVDINTDRMRALLTLKEGVGTGARLTATRVRDALQNAGVVHGVRDEVIDKALKAANAGTVVERVPVAEGTDPVDQSENRLEFLVGGGVDHKVRIRGDGTADYKTHTDIVTVEANQPVCRILPSQQAAVDGTDVLGQSIPARKSGDVQLEIGENIARDEQQDGSIVLRSTTKGEFLHERNRIEVRTTHTVSGDVDMGVGNIKFPGSVIVAGTVKSGFYVMSGGDIKIDGSVEAALLSSEGDITIKQGIKGSGKAVLRSKRNIMSPFVELATLLSVGDVVLKTAVVRSRIKCNGRITFQGDKGRVVGGIIRARNGIDVASIGSPRGVKTTISFGQDYLVADLIEKEEKEIEKIKRRITQVDLEMRRSEKSGATEQLKGLRQEKVKLLKLMEKRGLRLFTLRERFEQHFPSKVVIRGEVYSGTVFESHGRTFEVTRLFKGIAVEFNPHTGNIDINELNGS